MMLRHVQSRIKVCHLFLLVCPVLFFDEVHLTQKVTHVCIAFVAPVVSAR